MQRRRSDRILIAPHTALGAQGTTGCPGSPFPRRWASALQAFRLRSPWNCPFWIWIGRFAFLNKTAGAKCSHVHCVHLSSAAN